MRKVLNFKQLWSFVCDWIKKNESNITNVDFELLTKKVINSNVSHCLKSRIIGHILATSFLNVLGFEPNGSIFFKCTN